MEKKGSDEAKLSKIVSIPVGKIDVNKIYAEIKEDTKKKKIRYLEEISETIPDIIDTWENSEYLLEGWYDPENIEGVRARWMTKEASFLFDIKDNDNINLNIIKIIERSDAKSLKISLWVKNKKIDEKKVDSTCILSFSLPKKFKNKVLTYTIKSSRSLKPFDINEAGDFRELTVAIKNISNFNHSESAQAFIPALYELEKRIKFSLERINYHANPENILPRTTRLKFLKKAMLRTLKVYTAGQVAFNSFLVEDISLINDYLELIFKYSKSIDNGLINLEKEIFSEHGKVLDSYLDKLETNLDQRLNSLKIALKTKSSEPISIYFPQFEEDFYLFQQEKFRGSYKLIKERQKKYIPYIENVKKLSSQHPFIDVGFGRGEFLSILRENGIKKIIGVDTNSMYVKKAKANGYQAFCEGGISFLTEYKGSLSGLASFHLVEHLRFEQIFDLLYIAHKKLVKGGIIIIETPNPENLQVSGHSFYFDHTHKTKLPPLFFKAVFEYLGFSKIEIVYNLPVKSNPSNDIERILFGPQDYAIVAYK